MIVTSKMMTRLNRQSSVYIPQSDGANSEFLKCSMIGTNLSRANLYQAKFSDTNLSMSSLKWAQLIQTNFSKSDLSYSKVYGSSVWNCKFEESKQHNIIINNIEEPIISIDNIEIAQFIYLLINNPAIRQIINTVTSKVVLILGRFTDDRLKVLQSIREELRKRNYVPVLFDFENAENRDLTETVSTLAHLSRFVIADLTDARSIPQELSQIVPHLPSVPIQPIILESSKPYAMFEHFERYPWVLDIRRYNSTLELNDRILSSIIDDSESLANNL